MLLPFCPLKPESLQRSGVESSLASRWIDTRKLVETFRGWVAVTAAERQNRSQPVYLWKSNLGLWIYSAIQQSVLPDLCATRSLLILIRFGSAWALGCAAGSQAQHMVCCRHQHGASCGSGMIPDPAWSAGWCRQMTPDLASSAGTATPWTFLTNLRWQSEFLLAVSWLQSSWCSSKHLKAVLSSSQNHAFKHPLSNICMCRGGV